MRPVNTGRSVRSLCARLSEAGITIRISVAKTGTNVISDEWGMASSNQIRQAKSTIRALFLSIFAVDNLSRIRALLNIRILARLPNMSS